MKRLNLRVSKRNEFGRNAMNRLRSSGNVPAVIYGPSGTTSLAINEKDLKLLLTEKGNAASLINVDIDGKMFLSNIADIQKDPISDKFLHVDFLEVVQTEKMTTVVPLEFFGESVGVKINGGILDISRHEITVRCLPSDLPSSVRMDVSGLDVGDIFHLKDIQISPDVEILGDPTMAVVACKAIVEKSASSTTEEEEKETKAADETEAAKE